MSRRPSRPDQPQPAELTIEQMRQAVPRLQQRLKAAQDFDPRTVSVDDPRSSVRQIESSIDDALTRTFGQNTIEYNRYRAAASFDWPLYIGGTPHREVLEGVIRSRQRSIDLLEEAIRTLLERIQEPQTNGEEETKRPIVRSGRKVFIVHGHDEAMRETVARFVQQLDLEPIILHERPNKGRTIITKFREEAEDISFAVVLMTPDDEGGKAGGSFQARARQNVVFELGFFIGALGPDRVAALLKGDVERPSDFEGVVYISINQGHWKIDLAKEFRAAGIQIDFNKAV